MPLAFLAIILSGLLVIDAYATRESGKEETSGWPKDEERGTKFANYGVHERAKRRDSIGRKGKRERWQHTEIRKLKRILGLPKLMSRRKQKCVRASS